MEWDGTEWGLSKLISACVRAARPGQVGAIVQLCNGGIYEEIRNAILAPTPSGYSVALLRVLVLLLLLLLLLLEFGPGCASAPSASVGTSIDLPVWNQVTPSTFLAIRILTSGLELMECVTGQAGMSPFLERKRLCVPNSKSKNHPVT
ncbi:hypothetical protein K505DRAFT_341367 [Melanomma pulvis-pyrius CBS 109.77]|uniref:Uncharacterized protein n=1 Tax=Melanomma pulvis-pyrius CBS 109.77 TaxID=1314802 RepID=A0A6A6WZH1_9PLEO|nr:hypothetical protein K505DRAFT_341367 [Melanomma pulvis-pyrius CBS 109.77]